MKSAVDWNKNGGRQSGELTKDTPRSDIMRLSSPPQTEAKRIDASQSGSVEYIKVCPLSYEICGDEFLANIKQTIKI